MADRISLEEQYNNRSVIQQIYALKDTTKQAEENAQQAVDAANEATEAANNAVSKVSQYDADIKQLKISDAENTEAIASQAVSIDAHARAISALQTSDAQQDSEIQGLNESIISDLTGSFDNTSRTLKLSIERESAPSIDCDVVIPAGGTSGQYTGGNGINIDSNNVITAKVDDSTIKINENGQMYSVGGGSGGKTYTAGNGIAISTSDVISVDTGVVATKTDISDMETKTDANGKFATKTEFNSLKGSVGDAIKPIDIVEASNGLSVEMESLDGQKNSVLIPLAEDSSFGLIDNNRFLTAGYLLGGWNRSYFTYEGDSESEGFIYPSVDNTTIHYNDSNQLEVIGGGSSTSNDINLIRGSFDKNFPLTVTYNEQANLSVTKAYPFNTAYGGGDYILNSFVYSTSGGLKAKDVDFRILGSDRTVSSTSETDTFYVTGNWNDDLMVSVAERITAMLSNTDVGVGGSNLIKIRVQLYPISISTEGETTINVYSQTTTSNLWVDVFLDYAGNVIRTDMQTYANQGVTSKIKLLGHTVTVNLCGKVVSISNYTD